MSVGRNPTACKLQANSCRAHSTELEVINPLAPYCEVCSCRSVACELKRVPEELKYEALLEAMQ